jgi:hypothetical protein
VQFGDRALKDLSITSCGLPWDRNVQTVSSVVTDLPKLLNDSNGQQRQLQLRDKQRVSLKALLGAKNFCYASCVVPLCRAKVRCRVRSSCA